MSSSNSSITGVGVTGSSSIGYSGTTAPVNVNAKTPSYQFTVGTGIGITATPIYEAAVVQTSKRVTLINGTNGGPSITVLEDEGGQKIAARLEPDSGISVSDMMKIFMLVHTIPSADHSFSALAFIRKNNLERHFRFSVA